MWSVHSLTRYLALVLLSGSLPLSVLAGNVLSSSGFTNCINNATITVNNADVSFDQSNLTVIFDVSGTSSTVQKVMASLVVTAYGSQVYQKSFNPCDPTSFVTELCPGKLFTVLCFRNEC